MKEKTIAVLLATYNGEKYLHPLLDSLFAQTEQRFTLLVSDDCSADRTPDILREYAVRYPGRMQLVDHDAPTGSSQENFMLLTRQAGEYQYVMYCDQDDVWKPDKIEKTLRKMRETEKGQADIPCLIHTDLSVVDENLNPLQDSFFYSSMLRADRDRLNTLLIQNIVTGCTMMINHALWELTVLPLQGGRMRMHDGWFALIAAALGRIGFVEEATILYRQHGDNVVGAKNVRSFRYISSFAGRLRRNSQSIREAEEQAGALEKTLGDRLSPEQRRMLTDFAGIRQHNKFRRIAILRRYGIWLLGFRRRAAEILLI